MDLFTIVDSRSFFRAQNHTFEVEGVYEPKILVQLLESLALSNSCPKKILESSCIHSVPLPFKGALKNINTLEEYTETILKLFFTL